ncbi:hypothetical protein AQJ11_04020 [Streptomyces corchorusii]|uniref:Uncharacterized protein n=1 Tax=Streptomyces corchorusii TaxID=1903 RepID=A0A101QLH1_STRCK|nr:hypothetical protein AQJ11_04020 [Streptomyces corchorusii]
MGTCCGTGHAARNFHADLMARMGYGAEARRIQELISLVGPRERVAERLELWRRGPVTDLPALSPDPHSLRVLAELNS